MCCILLTIFTCSCQDFSIVTNPASIWDSFDRDTQGWKGSAGSITSFRVKGGNPGGYVLAADDSTGTWYFVAPTRIVSKMKGGYGKIFSFDLEQSATDYQYDADDIILKAGAVTLTYNTAQNPDTTWTSYRVKLDELSGWKKANEPVSKTDLVYVMANLSEVRIRGEFRFGADRCGIDNVSVH